MEVRKDYAVQMHDITIKFGSYTALDQVQLDVKKVPSMRFWEKTGQERPH